MKVALVDNMNNNFFAIARYFRDLGVDAYLYEIPKTSHSHFSPANDTQQNVTELDWIKKFPFDYSWRIPFVLDKKVIQKEFGEYDYVIACGNSVGLLNSAGIKVDMFIPYGGDLALLPFVKSPNVSHWSKWIPNFIYEFYWSAIQSKGIKNCKLIICNSNWEFTENAVKRLRVKSYNLPRLMIYLEDNPDESCSRWDFLQGYDFVVFSPSRHLWKTNTDHLRDFDKFGGVKRNDKLIRAFARVIQDNIFSDPILVLFEYGNDVQHSKELIDSLGIHEYVVWMPLLPRKYLLEGMKRSTFVADQFRKGMCATSSGTTNEALALGVPVIANTDRAIFNKDDPYFGSPIIDALEEDEIYSVFKEYSSHPDKYELIGRDSKRWFINNLGMGLARKYLELLEKL